MPTRWNSTLKMLELFVYLEDAINTTMAWRKVGYVTTWRMANMSRTMRTESMCAEKYMAEKYMNIINKKKILYTSAPCEKVYEPKNNERIVNIVITNKISVQSWFKVINTPHGFINE